MRKTLAYCSATPIADRIQYPSIPEQVHNIHVPGTAPNLPRSHYMLRRPTENVEEKDYNDPILW